MCLYYYFFQYEIIVTRILVDMVQRVRKHQTDLSVRVLLVTKESDAMVIYPRLIIF